MGKYNGLTIQGALEEMYKDIYEVLNRSNMSEEDKQIIKDAYKECAHQVIVINSSACAFEEITKEQVGEEVFNKIIHDTIHSGLLMKKQMETYPNYPDDEDEE